MKIKIFDGAETEKQEKEVTLRLVRECGQAELSVVDADGNDVVGGIILAVTQEGEIKLCSGLNRDIGLKITKAGYIKVVKVRN